MYYKILIQNIPLLKAEEMNAQVCLEVLAS